MHWTTETWICPGCAVLVGERHVDGCALRATTRSTIWTGPAITPGIMPRVVVDDDVVATYLSCSHCDEGFQVGDVIFENRGQSLGIHGECILALAQMVPHELPSPAEIESEFDRRRAEILDGRT